MPSYRPGANSVRASKAEDSKCKAYGGTGHGALRERQEGCCGRSIRREQHLGERSEVSSGQTLQGL